MLVVLMKPPTSVFIESIETGYALQQGVVPPVVCRKILHLEVNEVPSYQPPFIEDFPLPGLKRKGIIHCFGVCGLFMQYFEDWTHLINA